MRVLVLLFCAGLILAAQRNYEHYDIENSESYFKEFMDTYNKKYKDNAEYQKRLEIFTKNLEDFNKKNKESDNAVYGIDKFSDLSVEEFLNTYTGLRGFGAGNCQDHTDRFNGSSAPDSFDWRDKKVVTRVKNQQHCGSCWAFSATGNLESQYAIKHKKLLDFSQQQLVDCDRKSTGCFGTDNMENPFVYWKNKGAMLESDYAYEGHDWFCRYKSSKVKAKLSGCASYNITDENKLKEVLYKTGPLSISLDADKLQGYHGGIIRNCTGKDLNHAVLLVGYGTDKGVPFWLIKNSWSNHYGEKGYVRVERGVNSCSMTDSNMLTALLA